MREFVDEPGVEFDYYLAEKMGRTVEELHRMTNAEYVGWQMYYARKKQRAELARLQAEAKGAT